MAATTPANTSELTKTLSNHAGYCMGYCRAQRFAMNSGCCAAFEKEKAAITSYEDGWDHWDGPVWPWRHTNEPESQNKLVDEWAGCCNEPTETSKVELLEQKLEKAMVEVKAQEIRPTRKTKQVEVTVVELSPDSPPSSLWSSRGSSPCHKCGCTNSSHL